jgi:nucleotide-binding universal stress UspA family protein
MFATMLVPLDGTAEAAVALPVARALGRAAGGAIRLVRVVRGDRSDEVATASANLWEVARELRASGVEASTVVRQGTPAEEIVGEAVDCSADLIAMATHGRSGLGRALLGSVADGVVTTSPVPVLLQRPGGHRVGAVRRLLVPVDGSPGGALALGVALGLARAAGARITLLEVVVPLVSYALGTSVDGGMAYLDPAWDAEATTAAQAYVGGMAARLGRAGVEAEGRAAIATIGTPSATIADAIGRVAAEVDADLIVMSTHALTGPARTVLGSVADAVVRESHRAVLLVRQGMRLPAIPDPVAAAAPTPG